MLTVKKQILASILGWTDALFSVDRHRSRNAVAVMERQAIFRTHGVPWRLQTGSHQSVRRQIEDAGLADQVCVAVLAHGAYVRLTDATDDDCRALAHLRALADSLKALDLIHGFRGDVRAYDREGLVWIRETMIADVQYGTPDVGVKLARLQEQLLACLVRGLIEWNVDRDGRAWYAATTAGSALAQERITNPAAKPKRRRADPEFSDAYFEAREFVEDALVAALPANESEVGPIPIPVAAPTRELIAKYRNAANV